MTATLPAYSTRPGKVTRDGQARARALIDSLLCPDCGYVLVEQDGRRRRYCGCGPRTPS